MGSQAVKGVKMDAHLDQEERHNLSKRSSRVVWKIRPSKDGPDMEDHKYFAGVCISPLGYILTVSLPTAPDLKYIGSCLSWKKGWTPLRLVRLSSAYGLSLFQLEEIGRKKVDFTDIAESGLLGVNQTVYGVGHPIFSGLVCENTFVRGSVEYPCEDIIEMPPCLIDGDSVEHMFKDKQIVPPVPPIYVDSLALCMSPNTRMVKHLTWISSVKKLKSTQETFFSMHPDIPVIQIKNFHLGHCGGPVFVSSGHVVGINLFKYNDINFAVHLSAIKCFLKVVNLTTHSASNSASNSGAQGEVEQTPAEDQ